MATKLTTLTARYELTGTGKDWMPYILTGKRGAAYRLMRQVGADNKPKMNGLLFAVSARTGKIARLGNTEWVQDDKA